MRLTTIVGGLAAVVLASVALVAGCGGSDSTSSASTAATTATDAPPTTATPTDATGTSTTPAPKVRVNVVNRQLQKDLAALGFYKGRIGDTHDAATVAAVKAFQHRAAITADGIAGPQTYAAIDIARGRRSSGAVSLLQQALAAVCAYSGPINGVYTSATEGAVRQFQITHGLTVDGQYGPGTGAALARAYIARPESCATKPAHPTATHQPASGGSEREPVTVTVKGPAYGPKTFDVLSCTNAGETDLRLDGAASPGYRLTVRVADGGRGKITITGGDESDGVLIAGTISTVSVGDAGDIRASGRLSPESIGSANGAFTLIGRCA